MKGTFRKTCLSARVPSVTRRYLSGRQVFRTEGTERNETFFKFSKKFPATLALLETIKRTEMIAPESLRDSLFDNAWRTDQLFCAVCVTRERPIDCISLLIRIS